MLGANDAADCHADPRMKKPISTRAPEDALPEDTMPEAMQRGSVSVAKSRLDLLLVEKGLASSRAQAQGLIMAGKVFSGERKLEKPGLSLAEDTPLVVRGPDHPYVSRGGVKLAAALEQSPQFEVQQAVCLDIGASTGGFTDVLLQNGAQRVYAVDVGHGQLDWGLRNDPRVVVLERTNARHLTAELVPETVDGVVCDASFISLKKVLPAALSLARSGAFLAALIKPQFEVGRGLVGKGGVVRDPLLHEQVQTDIRNWLETEQHWQVLGIVPSPILGPQGNREFVILAEKPAMQKQPA